MSNPLKNLSRAPKIYVKLPSLGKFYPKDFIYTSPNGEIPVKAMTATDDMIMNTPDALLNGDAVFQVLKSCISECKDVRKLSIPDVEALLVAIRYASKGDQLTFETTCPKCEEKSEEIISIRMLLDTMTTVDDIGEPSYHEYDVDTVKVRINMQPSPYLDITNSNIVMFEQQRMVQFFQANPDIPLEERNERLRESFDRMANLQLNILFNSIESVDIIDASSGEEVVTKVVDKKHIMDFVHDLEKDHAVAIQNKLEKLNKVGVAEELDVICEKNGCNHQYKMGVKFDPTNFSDQTFSTSEAKK